jgi:carboxylesterase
MSWTSQPWRVVATPNAGEDLRGVVVLHGLCSASAEVRLFSRSLRDRGYRVVTPRIPGYSVTEPDGQVPYERWIDAAGEAARELARTCRHVHLCGVSVGATLALAVAATPCSFVRSLSLMSTTLFYDGWNVSRWRFLLPFVCYTGLGRWYSYRETPPYGVKNERVRAWIEGQLARDAGSSTASRIPTSRLREADRLMRHVKRHLADVHLPILLIHARHDDLASLANVRYVAARVSSGVVREAVLDDSYHMITLDNERDVAALRTIQFFEWAEAAQASAATPGPSRPAGEA